MRLAIFGGGRAAWAFGSTWRRLGWPLAGVWIRDGSSSSIASLLGADRRTIDELAADADLVLLAVTDSALEEVAAAVPPTNAIIFHASGAMPSLSGGFSLHPLKALPPAGAPSDLRDSMLVFEGQHRETGRRIAEAAGARFAEVSASNKPLYHAAAVFGSNYAAAMVDIAARLMDEAGVHPSRDDLTALAASALANWSAFGDSRRFTGPAARGDANVLRDHLAALESRPEIAEIYRLIAAQIAGASLATEEKRMLASNPVFPTEG